MELLLLEEADRARDIAEILSTIRNNDKDHVKEITLAVTGLEDLKSALRRFNDEIASRHQLSPGFVDDLKLLQNSVAFTLQDVWTILGKIPRPARAVDYRNAWKEVVRYCANMGRQSFHVRLETYILFTNSLNKVLQRVSYSRRQFDELRHEIYDLQSLQREDRRLLSASDSFANLSLVPVQQVIRQPPSHERVRPQAQRPMSPTASHDSYDTIQNQAAPSPPPHSPITTFSSISHNSSLEPDSSHWATNIFNNLPCTALEDHPDTSSCRGDVNGKNFRLPDPEYERILQLKFPGGLRTKFYWRPRDYRSKMVCEWYDSRKNLHFSCFPLGDLHIRRSGPLLYLCCPTIKAASTLWTTLKFTSYEWLVIFHCTFLSLRSHDSGSNLLGNIDHELRGETPHFAGAIRDSGYKHALRLYRDKSTDALRLEASVYDKDMRDTPIWTAFITHKITSPTWYRWSKDSSTVYLAELQRYVFSSEYSPHVRANGEHLLDFELISDAEAFVETLGDLRAVREAYRPPQ